MNSSSSKLVECRVRGAEKLPVETGGADALCASVTRAAAHSFARNFKVEVRVLTGASLVATLTTSDGTILPEQRFAISDRKLTKGSLERFANSLVATVAQAPPRQAR